MKREYENPIMDVMVFTEDICTGNAIEASGFSDLELEEDIW